MSTQGEKNSLESQLYLKLTCVEAGGLCLVLEGKSKKERGCVMWLPPFGFHQES